jgi:hypothetical protein
MMMVNMEKLVERRFARETVIMGGNMAKCNFLHQKFHIALPVIEPGPMRWNAGDETLKVWNGAVST